MFSAPPIRTSLLQTGITVGTMIEISYYHPPLNPTPPITAEAVVSEPLEYARPLTQRTLSYLRQNTRRADEYIFFTRPPNSTLLTESGFILSKNGPADEYDFPAQISLTKRDSDDEANHPTFDFLWNPCTPRNFLSPLSHLRAPPRREVISMNAFNKKTPIAATSTANPGSPSASNTTYSATASLAVPLLFCPASGPGLSRSRNQRPSSRNQRPSSSLPHMRHCAHLWNKIGNTLKRKMLRISLQDVKCDLQEEKTETTTYATGLVNSKHRLHNEMLLTNATALAASVHDAEASIYTLENNIRESRSRLAALQVQQHSASARARTLDSREPALQRGLQDAPMYLAPRHRNRGDNAATTGLPSSDE